VTDERHEFACPHGSDDPDERRRLILAEHPELARAIDHERDEVVVGRQPINPRLHRRTRDRG
jgi:hypothetical protein